MYNKENLLRMADYIETVPQEKFDMDDFRAGKEWEDENPICGSVGCVVGHCTALDGANVVSNFLNHNGGINFKSWIEDFTGVRFGSKVFNWLFSYIWPAVDNTPTGAAKRIRHFVEHGLPDDWEQVMNGEKPLPYEN